MPTPRATRSGGASPSGAGLNPVMSPLSGRRVSPRDRRGSGDKSSLARSPPAQGRSPLAEIFGSPEMKASRGSVGGVAGVPDNVTSDLESDSEDAMEAIMATQAALPADETMVSPTQITDSQSTKQLDDPSLVATQRLSDRVFKDTGKRLSVEWKSTYEDIPSGGTGNGKRKRLWFVSPSGRRFDGPGKVAKYVESPKAEDKDVQGNQGNCSVEPVDEVLSVVVDPVISPPVRAAPVTTAIAATPRSVRNKGTRASPRETEKTIETTEVVAPAPVAPIEPTPPPPITDRRAGDAAARHLRRRLLSCTGSGAPNAEALNFCPELMAHQKHLVEILGDTVCGNQNNSVLLVGGGGSGKTTVLDSALNELKQKHGAEKTLVVRLSGMLHADEKVGMREIALQLCAAGDELEFSRAAGFMENVAFMREVLRILEQGGRAVIFVLEAFDLFAKGGAKSKQTLLYAVMDLLQQNSVQAAVVGVTSRHDAVEMLEKRVRSRFSFRRILLAPNVGDVRAKNLLREALRLPDEKGVTSVTNKPSMSIYPAEAGFEKKFNTALDVALETPAAVSSLTRFEALECTPRSVGDLALVVLSRFDRDAGVVTAKDIAYGVQTLLADTYVRSLAGSSVLELCLVVAMSRLHRFRNMRTFNVNHVENELKSMAANDFLGDAGRAKGPVLLRAFEGLLAMGICEAQGTSGGFGGSLGTGGGASGASRGRNQHFHKHFRGIQLLVTDEEVEVAVEKHPQKPAGLKELLTHEGVRAATGF